MTDLEGKVALVTGGASGIGRAVVRLLVARGARVMVADVDRIGADDTVTGLPGTDVTGCDVGDAHDVANAVESTVERWGGLDIMVNDAGVVELGALTELTTEQFDRVHRANVLGTFHGTKFAAPRIAERGGGAIVSVASVAGLSGVPMMGSYASSKAAIISMTRTSALELRPLAVRVNCVCPGLIDTPLASTMQAPFEDAGSTTFEEVVDAKQGRLGDPDDVARAVAYLASDEARLVSGIALPVDNGLSASLF